jgi:hypothetical protein
MIIGRHIVPPFTDTTVLLTGAYHLLVFLMNVIRLKRHSKMILPYRIQQPHHFSKRMQPFRNYIKLDFNYRVLEQ